MKTVLSKDARYDPMMAVRDMSDAIEDGQVVAVALVGICSNGSIRLYGSESAGQTLNLLEQGKQAINDESKLDA